jgi:hypothetical protein
MTSARRDLPRAVLVACVHVFGAGRPEWGRAMLAELAEIDEGRARRRFALGCARALVLAMPPPGSARVVSIGAFAAGAASLALVVIALLRYPGVVSGAGTWVAVGAFGILVVLYVVTAARLGAPRMERRLLTTVLGAGATIAASWLAIGLNSSEGGPKALTLALLGLGPVVGVAIGRHATARSGSTRTGVRCVGITALVAGFAVFLMWAGEAVVTAGRPYDAGLVRDFASSGGADLATYAVNESLGTAMMLLLLVPLVSAATGLVGTKLATSAQE